MTQWLLLSFCAIVVQGFFALFEMSCVSFHKIRLQYYVSQGKPRALWLHYLLKRPSRLFGTTLIGINASLQIGSECARRFYESIHLDPDWAPLTQVFLVVILGELVPMFAARRHPERIAITFVPFVIFLARLLSPITWTFNQISKGIHRLMATPQEAPLFLSREEVRMAFEEREEKEDTFNALVNSVFELKNETAKKLMLPLSKVAVFPLQSTVSDVQKALRTRYVPILPLFERTPQNIVSVVNVRDLLRLAPEALVQKQAKSPWFVTENTSILTLLDQFRSNNQKVALILDQTGQVTGILTLDQIIDAIWGGEGEQFYEEGAFNFIERTLKGSMTIGAFNAQFEADLAYLESMTLSELILSELHHPPSRGETVRVGVYEFTVLEPTLRGVRTLSVHTLSS
jgi:putative hemolysin